MLIIKNGWYYINNINFIVIIISQSYVKIPPKIVLDGVSEDYLISSFWMYRDTISWERSETLPIK